MSHDFNQPVKFIFHNYQTFQLFDVQLLDFIKILSGILKISAIVITVMFFSACIHHLHLKTNVTLRSKTNVTLRSKTNVTLRSKTNVTLRSKTNVTLRSKTNVTLRSKIPVLIEIFIVCLISSKQILESRGQ